VAKKILEHLGLPAEPLPTARAQAPPAMLVDVDGHHHGLFGLRVAGADGRRPIAGGLPTAAAGATSVTGCFVTAFGSTAAGLAGVRGLLALMLYAEARRPARRDDEGRFVPLSQQDPSRWHSPLIVEAEGLLADGAARARGFGRFLCEAAIRSVHVQRAVTGVAQHDALRVLYDVLVAHVSSLGARLGRAAALLAAGDVDGAATAIADIALDRVERYQPHWVTRALIDGARGDLEGRRSALTRAIGLTDDPAVGAYLRSLGG
jgi:hypothetical protein